MYNKRWGKKPTMRAIMAGSTVLHGEDDVAEMAHLIAAQKACNCPLAS